MSRNSSSNAVVVPEVMGLRGTPRVVAVGVLALVVTTLSVLVMIASPAHAVSTFTVNSTADLRDKDSADGVCDTGRFVLGSGPECTLRAAIQQANDTPNSGGNDLIKFQIPGGTAVKTISPASALPAVLDPVTIDGYTQPGASLNTQVNGNDAVLLIELNGANAGTGAYGLRIGSPSGGSAGTASNSLVRGLAIHSFSSTGILIGIDTTGTKLRGNFIGTDPSGTAGLGNDFHGVLSRGNSTIVGGDFPEARNVISGNSGHGVAVFSGVLNNAIRGNFIGTTKDGTGNMGNFESGVTVVGSNTTVGGASGAAANRIAFNGRDGVVVSGDASTGNSVQRNFIFANVGLGIDLIGPGETFSTDVSTANDGGRADDADTGPNGLQNKPGLTSATTPGDTTTVLGVLDTKPNTTYTVQFFSQPNGNEGQEFIGQKQIGTDSDGRVTFTFSPPKAVAVGQKITATATGPEGTSEFSAPREVTAS